MKKSLLITVLVAFIAGGVGAYVFAPKSGSVTQKESAYERVMRTGVLRCGYGPWEPGFMIDPNTGKFSGVTFELAESVASLVDLKIEWVAEIDWGHVPEALESGKVDAICAGPWRDPVEGKRVRYTDPLYYNPVYIFTQADDHRFDNDLSLINDPKVKIALVDGDNPAQLAKFMFPKATPYFVPTMSSVSGIFESMITRKADVTIQSPNKHFMENNPGKLKIISGTPLRLYAGTIGVSINEERLASLLNNGVYELHAVGESDRILNKYMEEYPGTFVKVKK